MSPVTVSVDRAARNSHVSGGNPVRVRAYKEGASGVQRRPLEAVTGIAEQAQRPETSWGNSKGGKEGREVWRERRYEGGRDGGDGDGGGC